MDCIKEKKKTIIITTLLCIVPSIVGLLLWDKFPDMLPVHFNVEGEPDSYMNKSLAILVIPVFMAVLELVCIFLTKLDPKKKNISPKALGLLCWIMPAISWICCGITYTKALGYEYNISATFVLFMGVLYLVIGNYLPKNAQNFSVGVRTSWALSDEQTWNYSNRFAAITFIVSGVALLILGLVGAFTGNTITIFIIAFAIVLISSLLPVVASYLYYRKNHKSE